MRSRRADAGAARRPPNHYFPSKPGLFRAAADAALDDSLSEAAALVLAHGDARGRLHGLVDFYRVAHRDRPHLVPFFAVLILESVAASHPGPGDQGGIATEDLADLGQPVRMLMRALAQDAADAGELAAPVDADTAALLLQVIITGVGLASLDPTAPFPALLDALDLLIDGQLLR